MNTKSYSLHNCSFLFIQNDNFFQLHSHWRCPRKGAFTDQNALGHTIFSLCHSINFGILYFIWQPYQLQNSLLPFNKMFFTPITTPPIPALSPLLLYIRPYSSHACTITITSRMFSCLQSLSTAHRFQNSLWSQIKILNGSLRSI